MCGIGGNFFFLGFGRRKGSNRENSPQNFWRSIGGNGNQFNRSFFSFSFDLFVRLLTVSFFQFISIFISFSLIFFSLCHSFVFFDFFFFSFTESPLFFSFFFLRYLIFFFSFSFTLFPCFRLLDLFLYFSLIFQRFSFPFFPFISSHFLFSTHCTLPAPLIIY